MSPEALKKLNLAGQITPEKVGDGMGPIRN
jgi:hypothetical protein